MANHMKEKAQIKAVLENILKKHSFYYDDEFSLHIPPPRKALCSCWELHPGPSSPHPSHYTDYTILATNK